MIVQSFVKLLWGFQFVTYISKHRNDKYERRYWFSTGSWVGGTLPVGEFITISYIKQSGTVILTSVHQSFGHYNNINLHQFIPYLLSVYVVDVHKAITSFYINFCKSYSPQFYKLPLMEVAMSYRTKMQFTKMYLPIF